MIPIIRPIIFNLLRYDKINVQLNTYLQPDNHSKYFELIGLWSMKIPKVRELNLWFEEEEKEDDETLVCIYISPYLGNI